ncbi:MAG: T9SS type A sorting domain-containing protein [Ignavibacteriaceae bacterium]|jgi:hypothetical protein
MKRIFTIVLLSGIFSAVIFAQITREQCYVCHSNSSLQKTITLTSSTEIVPLYVDSTKFKLSKHATLLCVNCHTDITTENQFNHKLSKYYGGWARFSAKNDTVTAGQEKTRNYTTVASKSCNQNGCHLTKAAVDSSAHFLTFKQKHASVRTVNGESVGEAYVNNDCNRCHSTCSTCHFKSNIKQFQTGDVLDIWAQLQASGDGTEPLKTQANNLTQYQMDWTTNVASHTFLTGDSLRANNDVCQTCHIGFYKPPMNGFLSLEAPYPKAYGTNIKRHPQIQESIQSSVHKSFKCATCHTGVHSFPGTRKADWQTEGDVICQKCHINPAHAGFANYSKHTTVDCISCHFRGFVKTSGQNGHDVWRVDNKPDGRVRPLAMKYNEAVSWYPHNIEKPNIVTSCGTKCHYDGNLLGVQTFVVPVELTSFTGSISHGIVSLLWQTATEKNNQGFEIQRRISTQWETVGFVNGKGTSTEVTRYHFTDNLTKVILSSGFVSYRLHQLDLDGTSSYSEEVNVSFTSTPKSFELSQNHPNPFNPSTTIRYALPFDSNVKISIYKVTGELVKILVNGTKSAGSYEVTMNTARENVEFSSGIYFYSIEANAIVGSNTFRQTKKMILLK